MSPGGEILLSAEPAHAAAMHRTPRAARVRILRTIALRAPRLRDGHARRHRLRRSRNRAGSRCAKGTGARCIARMRVDSRRYRTSPTAAHACARAPMCAGRLACGHRSAARQPMRDAGGLAFLQFRGSAVPHPRAQQSHARTQRHSSRCVQLRRHAIAHTVHHWTRRSTSRGGVPQPRYALRFARRAPAPARSAARCASRHQSRSMPTSSSTSAGVS
ncbi:nnrU domain protein [Burkholderia pseudomallei MSHR332]|nr:nnrU domain protein [Burkholderia pseudomallei MSHR332]